MLIAVIAIVAHSLDGDLERSATSAANVRERSDGLTAADFFRSFPLADDRATPDRASAGCDREVRRPVAVPLVGRDQSG